MGFNQLKKEAMIEETATSAVVEIPRQEPTKSWNFSRQLFFIKQRIFYALSFLLLDNLSSGKLRSTLLRLCGARIGDRCFVRGGLRIQESFNLVVGNDVFVNAECCFDLSAPITLCDGVQLAYQVTIVTGGHEFGPRASRAGAHAPRQVVVGPGAWIGARAIILPGVMIGDGAVVAAGAVVTRDVPPDSVVAGVPAKIVRKLE